MNKPHRVWPLLVATGLLLPAVSAQQSVTNRFTLSARFGLNISARFKGAPFPAIVNPRTTPDGDHYNYDDGYVLTDLSGNLGGQTWYWGYDNSAEQISGNTILLSRATPAASFSSPSFSSDPNYGAELTYNRQLAAKGNVRLGFEVAANYLNLALRDKSTLSSGIVRVTDAYPFTPGTTPPHAPPPYQGSFTGPGFVIGDTPVGSTSVVIPGDLSLTDWRQFDADIWGLRLGPYFEIPLGKRVNLSASGGFALAWLRDEASWTETASIAGGGTTTISGSGHDHDVLWGGYVGANVSWQFREHWSAVGGAQYQNLGDYRHAFGGRRVEVDLSHSVFVTLGLGYRF